MVYRWIHWLALGSTGLAFCGATLAVADEPVQFERDVAPLLLNRCVECHQGAEPSGGLLLTTQAGLLAGGESGAAVDLDTPSDSELLLRVHGGEMPPAQKGVSQQLPADEIAVLQRWIAGGADWPADRKLDWFERTSSGRSGRDWWSLQPVVRPSVPRLTSLPQPPNPIDAFVFSGLERAGFVPAPQAAPRVLLRRLYVDLTGLPPTQMQIEAFEADPSDQAWDQEIDRLLDSPQYGQRWARYWLDLVRYADTSGYERDQEKPFAWKYRDWVVDALNADMPVDQFIIQQLAGDEIPGRTEKSTIATGFLRLGTWNDEPNDPLDYQYDRLEDLVHTTSSAFLGLTVKCARCHAHKFDPIMQEDYYRMASAFWAGPIGPRARDLLGGPSAKELGFDDVLGWTDLTSKPEPIRLLANGERDAPLQEVRPASLSMFPQLEREFEAPPEDARTSQRRLQLAQWIAHPENPLTARVYVNRLWGHHFGAAIVRSPNNFGFLADPPTHPRLLDWLAAELVSGDWKTKRIHKLILTSQTWRQSSLHPQSDKYETKDAGNRLWWRAKIRRLDAEALRDSMLATTGELDLRLGGPGFQPEISAAALEGLSRKSKAWQVSPQQEQFRRSLYLYSKRALLSPMMTTFNFSDANQSCAQRDVTTVPTQALVMMNNPFVHDRSQSLAKNAVAQSDPVQAMWSAVLARSPAADERRDAERFLASQRDLFAQSSDQSDAPASVAPDVKAAADPSRTPPIDPTELALASLAQVLINSNEFLYVD
ncbi:Planctomycete cytochrome C [Rubripirellula lacrimiformis]|uniref:Planctomycete cytochrome C n=1 Tax=Rubripirellula lacrimiformis TaxID=1930273 RepID=A0A517N9I6_9BACT|nr:PSD1 and planctomycete cytochrome C domain-containing protein [Rubripirellula lacrimiformis]QDT03795.1 Planctomycete cytochrome C [Rubripirellula lacrimiformis]